MLISNVLPVYSPNKLQKIIHVTADAVVIKISCTNIYGQVGWRHGYVRAQPTDVRLTIISIGWVKTAAKSI
jgi:hypothetical protein